jgi:exosortase
MVIKKMPSAKPVAAASTKTSPAWTWGRIDPLSALLLATIVATLVYFFGFAHLFIRGIFISGPGSVAAWAWQAWSPSANQEHSKLVPLISLALVWYHRKGIRNAAKRGSNKGLIFVAAGIVLFLLGARCVQPRLALGSLPFLIYGSVLYLWGAAVARIVLFPCAFLIFLIPFGAIEQATFRLQFIITGVVGFLSNLVGIKIDAVGTTLTAADNSFNFLIAEGCSGVRSIAAMTMISAIYVHLTQDKLWKKLTIFAFSLVFAIFGNIGRIFTVVLVARFINPAWASGIYHDYSGYVFFPIALLAMLAFSKLINLNWGQWFTGQRYLERDDVKYDY